MKLSIVRCSYDLQVTFLLFGCLPVFNILHACGNLLITFRLTFMSPCIVIIILISNEMQLYTVYFIWKLLYMFRVLPSPIIRRANNCIYSIWYLSHRYCSLPLSWKSWNWFECAVRGVRHPQHTQTSSSSSTIAADRNNGVTNTRCCRYSCLRS